MSTTLAPPPLSGALQLDVRGIDLTEERFLQLCADNPQWRLELTADQELVIMPPTGTGAGPEETHLVTDLNIWNRQAGGGVVLGGSAGFRLPNRAIRAADAAWVRQEVWNARVHQRRGFATLCPDFVAEIRSPSDLLSDLQAKLEEYLANGARLGWLIDPEARRVYVYRPGAAVEVLDNPPALSGDPVLPGFVFPVRSLW